MSEMAKLRIAYTGAALEDGVMDINDLAPALMAYGNLVKRINTVIGNEQPVRVLLKADEIRRGSFDITLLLDYSILEEARLFMGIAENTGIKDLVEILGMGVTIKESIFWLVKAVGFRKIKKVEKADGYVNIIFEDKKIITVNSNVYNVYIDHESRSLMEKVVAPVKKDGIESFEIRNVDDVNDKSPTISVEKDVVDCFKTPELESKVEPDNIFEQEMLLKIVGIVFDENQKWRFSDGEVTFWARIEDEKFWNDVNNGEIAFRKGDRLRVCCKVIQKTGADESIITERAITKVIKILPKPTQIKLNFEEE